VDIKTGIFRSFWSSVL